MVQNDRSTYAEQLVKTKELGKEEHSLQLNF